MKCALESPGFTQAHRLQKREGANSAETYEGPFNILEERQVTESGLITGKEPQEQGCSTGAAEKNIWEKRQDFECICCPFLSLLDSPLSISSLICSTKSMFVSVNHFEDLERDVKKTHVNVIYLEEETPKIM